MQFAWNIIVAQFERLSLIAKEIPKFSERSFSKFTNNLSRTIKKYSFNTSSMSPKTNNNSTLSTLKGYVSFP